MKNVLIIIAFLVTACSNQREGIDETSLFAMENSNEKLSVVIQKLLDKKVRGYVIISHAALEYSTIQKAKEDSSKAKSIVEFDVDRFDHHTPVSQVDERFYPWGSSLICREVIADHGEVVEVRTLDPDEDPEKLGHGTRGADYIYALTTFIRKIDLVPVLSRAYSLKFEDNSYIKFEPGVAVGIPWEDEQTKRAVSIQQLHFEFSVPDSLLALCYAPIMKSLQGIENKKMLDEDAVLFLNGTAFCKVSEIRNQRLRTPISYQKFGDHFMYQLVENGIQFQMTTDDDLVASHIPDIEGPTLTNRYDTPPRWYARIPEGTPVYWDNGKLAGKTRQYFGRHSEIPPSDSTWCGIAPELFENEPLCFKLKDINVVENE